MAMTPVAAGGTGSKTRAATMPAKSEKKYQAQLKAQGCRTFSFAGHEVFEICFKRGDGLYHLYLARRSDFTVGENAELPVVLAQAQRSVAAWADQRLVYVLMAGGGAEAIRRIL